MSGLYDLVIRNVVLPTPEIKHCCGLRGSVCESAVLLEDKELSQQLMSGTCICELVCRLQEDILSKFCDNGNNYLNMCGNFNMITLYCTLSTICVIFEHLQFTSGVAT